MTQHEFNTLVAQMRQAQKSYFKSDPHSAAKREFLIQSREFEKQVDEALRNLERFGSFDNPQKNLF